MNTKRLYFIDAVRAFAILMMLQGHFIDTLLEPSYRENTSTVYKVWSYFRGITAPTFFTISGLIFSYLLIKAKKTGNATKRIRKGLIRGVMLICMGYLLRIPLLNWFAGKFSTYFMVIDVLQCIGLSLILIVMLYVICCKKTLVFSILMLLLGIFVFCTEPYYRGIEISSLPVVFSNYLSIANGSVFTIFPWFGYVAFGSFIATLFYRYLERPRFRSTSILLFFALGVLLINKIGWAFMTLYYYFDIYLFKSIASYNYLFPRLGNVLLLFSVFYLLETQLKKPLILKIGQKTLSIYVIHFIIIYGSFTGIGLRQLIGKTLVPWQAIIGAFIFLITVCFISFYYTKTNTFIYNKLRLFFIVIANKKRDLFRD